MRHGRLLQVTAAVVLLIVGFVLGLAYAGEVDRQEQERRERRVETDSPLRVMLEEREVVAGWFGVPATNVTFTEAPAESIPGGDRDWQVRIPGLDSAETTVPVITEDGLPACIELIPVPADGEIASTEWAPPVMEGLSAAETEAAEMMCFTVAKLLGLPAITGTYIRVVGVRARGSEPHPDAWVVTVQMEAYPWRDLGRIKGTVDPVQECVQSLAFNVD